MTTTRKSTTRTPKADTPENITDISYGPKAKVQRAAQQRAATKKPVNRPAAPSTLSGGVTLDPSRFWEQGEDGETFQHRLAVTFPNEEVYVTCRTVEVMDVVLEGNFPYGFTSQMIDGLQAFAGDENALDVFKNAGDSMVDVVKAMSAAPELKPFVDALFVSAVIDPPCYLDKEEARAAGGLWVGHVRLMDKLSLMATLQQEDDGLAATFRPAAEPAV